MLARATADSAQIAVLTRAVEDYCAKGQHVSERDPAAHVRVSNPTSTRHCPGGRIREGVDQEVVDQGPIRNGSPTTPRPSRPHTDQGVCKWTTTGQLSAIRVQITQQEIKNPQWRQETLAEGS